MDQEVLELERYLPLRLTRLANRLGRAVSRAYAERFGLSIAEWRIIAVLVAGGPCVVRELAEQLAVSKVTVGRAAGRLAERGHVVVVSGRGDRRRLELTPQGRTTYGEIVPGALEAEAQTVAALSVDERAVLLRVVRRLEARAATLPRSDGWRHLAEAAAVSD